MYLGVDCEKDKSALLCVSGARREDGVKELLAMELGYRESTERCADALPVLRDRGFCVPMVAVEDRALGLWVALDHVFPRQTINDTGTTGHFSTFRPRCPSGCK